MDYLIENDYYINFYDMYTFEEIKEVFKSVYNKKFRFASFMSASKFYQSYALRDDTGEKFLERYEDRISIVSLYLAQGNKNKAMEYAEMLINQEYQPATPTFLNSGKKRSGELVSCFLDEMGDNLSGIGYVFDSAMKLSSIGGGVSINLSKVRARGESIKGVEGRASGVLPIMKIMEDIFSYANQLGQRAGAGAVYLNVFHSDINEFLDCKKINVDEKIRIKSLSIGVIVPDKFMELAREDEICYTFHPHTVFLEYGQYLDEMDMNEMYEKLVDNPNVKKKKINARELLIKISQTQKESGYPYLFFKDNANKEHALKEIGSVKFSNLCTEIMQLSEVSDINSYFEEDVIRRGISCNLGSLNIATVMENKRIREATRAAIDSLTTVSDFFMMVNFYSLERSMEIAREKGETFKDFDKSEYANGNYFNKYLENEYLPQTEKVRELFEGIHIPTQDDWARLKEDVMKYGVYNAYRMAIAPNQSTSYIMNSTASIMPVVDTIEVREYGDSTTFYPMPYLTNDNYFFYKSAYDMDQKNILKLVSVIQRHVDQGISTILFNKSTDTTRDLAKLYVYAHRLGLKSLYYTRTRKATIEECISCSV